MLIVIVGGGEVGYGLAESLASRHDAVVIDQSREVCDRFEKLDVQFLLGGGTSRDVSTRARVAQADVFIACTGLDEVNIVACGLANQLGSPETICFVSRQDVLRGGDVPDETMRAVVVFMLFYILTFAVGAGIVILMGADFVSGISGTAALIGNVGPGFGTVGPMGSFADLHPVSRVVLTLEMWIGRLEILTVLVLFQPEVWRTARWRPD